MIRAHVSERHFGHAVDIFIVDHQEDGKRILHMNEDGSSTWSDVISGSAAYAADTPKPTVSLPWETARTVLDALTQHYQGAEDTRQLRRDYDAERKRVDGQTAVIADIAKVLAEKWARV